MLKYFDKNLPSFAHYSDDSTPLIRSCPGQKDNLAELAYKVIAGVLYFSFFELKIDFFLFLSREIRSNYEQLKLRLSLIALYQKILTASLAFLNHCSLF